MKHGLKSPVFWGLALLILFNIWVIVYYAPVEKTMGIVQKVFYFHVASAWVGLLAHTVVFAASVFYLWRRTEGSNNLALASAEIGTVFISCTLLTGPLWAYPIWNTWWTWDPRLTTTLVLWFMYVAYIALQGGGLQRTGGAWLPFTESSASSTYPWSSSLPAGGAPSIRWSSPAREWG